MYYEDCLKMIRLLLWAVLVHLILLVSVFDIYFRSPVLDVEPVPFPETLSPPADRVVLFVGDGVRADSFFTFNGSKSNAPFLRSILDVEGAFGISHAHVPTESRPGHVAILAGMYEDPSAIFKGWQNYIIDFDSIFNRSEASFSWGSPDILNIFSQGSTKDNAYFYSYAAEKQEFSGKNNSASDLSYWVAHQFERFLRELSWNERLENLARRNKTVFFFHFLGTDIAGHTSKPKSHDYLHNIRVVDECVERIHRMFLDFFRDSRTAFIFTSDHGMTDWGSHGDGTDDETLTPIVTWGAGLNLAQFQERGKPRKQLYPYDWMLPNYKRIDIEQADIAPLMAVLIGIPIPVNSVGVLPIDFINRQIGWVLRAVILNVYQLKAQFAVSREAIRSKLLDCFYKSFPEPKFETFLLNGSYEISHEDKVKNALKACKQYIKGINYYNNYYSKFLLTLLSLMYIGWMLKICIEIVKRSKIGSVVFSFNFHYLNGIERWDEGARHIFIFISVLTFVFLTVQGLEINFYVYGYLTIIIWWNVVPNLKQMFSAFPLLDISRGRILFFTFLFLASLEFLVFSFSRRNLVCYSVIGLNFFWAFEENRNVKFRCSFLLWFVSTLIVSMFPHLPSVGAHRSTIMVAQAGGLWLITRIVSIYMSEEQKCFGSYLHIVSIIFSTLNTLFVDITFQQKKGLFLTNQIISWSIFVVNLIMLKFGPKYLHHKFIFLCHCLCSPIILLTSSHEALFMCFLFGHLYIWISLEYYRFKEFHKESRDRVMWGPKTLKYSDFRIAFFFLTYVLLGFFGLGNIASLNSFDPSWVRSFITMFSPFTMMALIIFKTVVPIFLVICALRVIISICQESLEIIFCIVLLFCDVMGLHFFLSVTNEGSWLEIGTSLSQFILMVVLTLVLLLLYAIALLIMPQKRSKRVTEFYLEEVENLGGINML